MLTVKNKKKNKKKKNKKDHVCGLTLSDCLEEGDHNTV